MSAAIMPSGNAHERAINTATTASSKVIPILDQRIEVTVASNKGDSPRSPRRTSPIQRKYCSTG